MHSLLRLGNWEALLYASTTDVEGYVQEFMNFFQAFQIQHAVPDRGVNHLVIASPPVPDVKRHPTWLPESEHTIWRSFWNDLTSAYRYFCQVRSSDSFQCEDLRSFFTFSWPRAGYESLNNREFSEREGESQFFALVIEDPDKYSYLRIFQYSIFLATLWHVTHGGLCPHSAAVVRKDLGFLFLGDSLAGKTTLAQLSASVGNRVLADELNFVIRSEENGYMLAAATAFQPSSVGDTMLRPPLGGVFTIVKDDKDYLVPLSPMAMARALFDGFLQTPVGQKVPDIITGLAFQVACDIARRVPGYTLHFRKSPGFWDVIDAELGN